MAGDKYKTKEDEFTLGVAADPIVQYMSVDQLKKAIEQIRRQMEKASKELDFQNAAELRDEMFALKGKLAEKDK